MTDGPAGRHEKSMCVRVWLEVGHACEPRSSALGRALALDWRVWVRGVSGHDISHFVHKVVFVLNPASAFVYPKRVIQEPPYEIQESGCASIDIPIHVYLKYSDKPKRIRLKYSLHIENSTKSSSKSRCVYYDVENPSEPLWRALMQGGGEVVARAAGGGLLLLLADGTPRLLHADRYECKFVEPLETPRRKEPKRARRVEEICPKCGDPTATDAELRKHLRAVAMTEDEIDRVSRLYRAYGAYERARARSPGALALPPLSDPIYRVPELPLSLRGALTSVEGDYAMQ